MSLLLHSFTINCPFAFLLTIDSCLNPFILFLYSISQWPCIPNHRDQGRRARRSHDRDRNWGRAVLAAIPQPAVATAANLARKTSGRGCGVSGLAPHWAWRTVSTAPELTNPNAACAVADKSSPALRHRLGLAITHPTPRAAAQHVQRPCVSSTACAPLDPLSKPAVPKHAPSRRWIGAHAVKQD